MKDWMKEICITLKGLSIILYQIGISFLIVFLLPTLIYESGVLPGNVSLKDINSAKGHVIMIVTMWSLIIIIRRKYDKIRDRPFNRSDGPGEERINK